MARVLLAEGEAVRVGVARKTSGTMSLNSTSLADLDTGMDLVLVAASGNHVEVGLHGVWGDEGVWGYLDVATIVSGSPVTYFSSGTGTALGDLVPGWVGTSGVLTRFGPPTMLTLAGGDISGGTVRLRLRFKTSAAASKTLYSYSAIPLTFTAKNFGSG